MMDVTGGMLDNSTGDVASDQYHKYKTNRSLEMQPREDFTAFADVCFREFGDRVSQWTTIVEPNVISMASYDNGVFPPNRCSKPFGLLNCSVGDSTTEPYIATHNLLLSHASVVSLYRTKYQWTKKTCSQEPYANLLFDSRIMSPLVFGDYPKVMKKIARSRLPSFTEEQSEQLNHPLHVRVKSKKVRHLHKSLSSCRKGANVKGYYVWSFLDVFEFLAGFQSRFGLCYVDFEDRNRTRQPKLSALWYSDFLKKKKKTGRNINRMGLHERSHSQQ
ncbi:hypothetical protein GW17_00029721 [Ensete ventricosum]|nr:hypothetical protein GW17_00029721 [Ensete ventricosum]RZS19934.1 hypothetical protein BHM03_00052394 [Ensete ventricosum]